jgi:hypothetical protein
MDALYAARAHLRERPDDYELPEAVLDMPAENDTSD